MNKILRFSMLSLLMMLFGMSSYAQEITFDFTGDDAYTLFGFSGFSASGVSDGDFTETKSLTVDGVTVTVSPSTTGTPNRMWTGTLRMYGGTLTISSTQNISAINFTTSKWNTGNTANVGTLSGSSWTGSANEVVFTIAGNSQIKTIAVTLGEGEGEGSGEETGDDVDVQTVANIAAFKALDAKTEARLTLKDAEVLYVNGTNDIYVRDASGAIDFYRTGLSLTAGQKLNGSVIGVYDAYKNTPELVKSDNTNDSKITATSGTVTAKSIAPADAANYICDLVKFSGVTVTNTDGKYYVDKVQVYDKFKVLSTTPDASKTYDIEGILIMYGDVIELCPVKDYAETGSGDDPDVPVEDEIVIATVEEFNAAAESTTVWYQLTGAVTNLKDGDLYGNFDLVDETGSVYVYGLRSEKDGPKKQFQELIAAQGIEEGTKIVLIGNRGSYKGKIEVMNAYFVRVISEDEPVEMTAMFDATKDLGNVERGEGSIKKADVTMSNTDGILGNGQQYRFYKNATLTFSAPGCTITKIEFTDVKSNPVSGFGAPSTGKMEGTVWTGSASEVSFPVENKQVRATLINVTYTAGAPETPSTGSSQLSKYPYAKPELIAQAKELMEKGDEAAEELAELMKEIARSHALGEGLPEAEDITDQLSSEWTVEEFAAGEGIEGEGYYKAEGKDIVARVYQTVELKAGRYMLTATGRGQKYPTIAETIDERLQVMAINNDNLGRYQSIARNDKEGGVYGEGWDDASDYFTMTADGEAVLGAYFEPIPGRDSWAEVGNFRLVRLGDATRYISQYEEFYNDQAAQLDVLVHRTLKQDEWNSLVIPLDLGPAEIAEQFGEGTKVAALAKATEGVVEFASLKEASIEANVPVLVKPTAVKETNRYLFKNVGISTTVSAVVKAAGFDFVGFYNPDETPVEGGLGFDVMDKNGVFAALTTSAALVPTGDAKVEKVLIDGEVYFEAGAAEAKMNIIGANVPTPTAIDTIETNNQTDAIYNIAGQRVQQMTKGLYIIGGKKYLKK
ncbi:MAG: hypothetical protein K6C10_00250 [Prevotella sp.]|nr:hypothetical protein [Prevotella sp.]